MMNNLKISLLVVITQLSYGQKLVVLNDSTKIECESFGSFQDSLVLYSTSEKKVIPLEKVLGYYDPKKKNFLYKVPCQDCVYRIKGSKGKMRNDYQFLPRTVNGRIQVFEKVVTGSGGFVHSGPSGMGTMSGGGSYTYTVYFLQRDTTFFEVKTEDISPVRELIKDNAELVAQFDAKKFKTKNLVTLINTYNLASFVESKSINQRKEGTIIFFISSTKTLGATLRINSDQETYFNDRNVLSVSLGAAQPSKACFTIEGRTHCQLFTASPFVIEYFRIDVKSASVEIKSVSEEDAQRFFAFQNQATK